MKTFMLIMFVLNPSGGEDTFILSLGLSADDCQMEMENWDITDNENIDFVCEMEMGR